MTARPEIVGVYIPEYKNLRSVWLPWADGLTVVGQNGSGKSNLLEALALLIGTDATVDLARPRLNENQAVGLSILVREDPSALPVGPATLAQINLDALGDRGEQLARDMSWWRSQGEPLGETFGEAIAAWSLPEPLRGACDHAADSPLVMYTLESLSHSRPGEDWWWCDSCDEFTEPADDGMCEFCGEQPDRIDRTQTVRERVFRRTLLVNGAAAAERRSWTRPKQAAFTLSGTRAISGLDFTVLMELPITTRTPATLQWLPRRRSNDESKDGLRQSFGRALGPATEFVEDLVSRLPVTQQSEQGDGHWWLHEVAANAAMEELGLTAPGLFVRSSGEADGDWRLGVLAEQGELELGRTVQSQSLLDRFSDGQRRWLDEALEAASRSMDRHKERLELYQVLIGDVNDDEFFDAVVAASDRVYEAEREGYWTASAIDAVTAAIEPAFQRVLATKTPVNPGARAILRAFLPVFTNIDSRVVVRVFDEPEAHLHVGALRRVARALSAFRDRGQNIVIATHSPAFIDLEDWTTLHIAEGQVATIGAEGDSAHGVAAQDLGWSRGELLAGIEQLLIVEGEHDRLLLEQFYGSDLRLNGIALIQMFGTNNLLATADLDFVDRYVDVPRTVLLDYTRVGRVLAGRPETDEERKLVALRKRAHAKHLTFGMIGLDRPDIVCYLPEKLLVATSPNFPGWSVAIQAFERCAPRPSFKRWLKREYDLDLTTSRDVRRMLTRAADQSLKPEGELVRKMNEFLARVSHTEERP